MSSLIECPLCGRAFHHKLIQTHAAQCEPAPAAVAPAPTAVAVAAAAVAAPVRPEPQVQDPIWELFDSVWCRSGGCSSTPPEVVCHAERLHVLNTKPVRSPARYVLLWVQQDVRVQCNHALEYAVSRANQLQLPVVAVYGLLATFPGANERMMAFLAEGLCEMYQKLAIERKIQLVALPLSPPKAVEALQHEAAMIIVDRGYSRICRQWRREVAEQSDCRVEMVETNVVVSM